MRSARLTVNDTEAGSGERRATLTLADGRAETLWLRADRPLSTECGSDPFVMGTVLCVMQAGSPLHVHGRVSRALLAGLTEWQAAWSRWRPERYRPVEVTADEVTTEERRSPAAVAAFSGGVDASYTVLRHLAGTAGWQNVDLRAAMLVHGFDIPLDQPEAFERARARAARLLDGFEIDMLSVTTNFRDLPQDWEDAHALGIAGCMTALSPEFGVGLIGSGEPYDRLPIPWGSNPITDHLLSTRTMSIRHDGAGASRTDKLRFLEARPSALDSLRVCWEGDRLDRNCGHCEKCRRTKFNFALAGVEEPRCFDDAGARSGRGVTLRTAAQFAEWEVLASEARAAGRDDVLREVDAVLRWSRFRRGLARRRTVKALWNGSRRALRPLATGARRRSDR